MFKYLLSLVVALVVVSTSADAQYKRKKTPAILQGFYAEGKAGTNLFFGDIQDGSRVKFSGGLAARKEILRCLIGRVELDGGALGGESSWGASFSTMYFNFDFGADFTFLNLIGGYDPKRMWEPYIGADFGLLFFKPDNGFISSLNEGDFGKKFGDVDQFTSAPMWCGIAGVRYRINKNWGALLEVKGVMPLGTNSDMLDGQSSDNTDEESMVYLGEKKYDAYYTMMVGVSYKFADMSWKMSSKYNRKTYLHNRKVYKRNAKRTRRR